MWRGKNTEYSEFCTEMVLKQKAEKWSEKKCNQKMELLTDKTYRHILILCTKDLKKNVPALRNNSI